LADILSLNDAYSTTRRVTKTLPEFDVILLYPENVKQGGLRTKGVFKRSEADRPLITVVTVVYNGAEFLENTIKSVISQTYDNVEYIIIDGGSTDSTLNIIKKYEHCIDYWVSDKDDGIYDAMNKGIKLAGGDWINFMNSGDFFANSGVLSKIKNYLAEDVCLVYGNKVQNGITIKPNDESVLSNGVIMGCHQAMFFNMRGSYRDFLFYKTKYKIYADYDLVNRLFMVFGGFRYVDLNVAVFQGGGVSASVSKQKRLDKYSILYDCYGLRGVIRGLIHKVFK
jgi:glycosyltransferase involved in cell wall biosynthesis